MRASALLIVFARLLDAGVRGRPSRRWELQRWQSDCAGWRETLRTLSSRLPLRLGSDLRQLADLLADPYDGKPLSSKACAAWRDRLQAMVTDSSPILADANLAVPESGAIARFLMACEYRLRAELGERGKHARGAVADAWGISDDAVRVYASKERTHVDRFMAATVAGATDDRTDPLRSVLAEVRRHTPVWRGTRTPRRWSRAAKSTTDLVS